MILTSFLPNEGDAGSIDQALYLPLFYGDAQGVMHPGAAREVPSVQNGGISADGTTWTFHLRPHLVWSDGAPYDARDVDYTWKLWLNPKFGASFPDGGFELISSADVSADHLSITFHLKQAYAPFLSNWVDGYMAPLPAHQFSRMAPEAIVKSPDILNPKVTSGPFMMAESVPGDHYTLVRNPRYYRASEGLPYLDKVVFRIVEQNAILKDLQAGTITSARRVDEEQGAGVPAPHQLYARHSSHQWRLRGAVVQLPQHGAGQPPGSAPGDGDGDRSPGLDQGGSPGVRHPLCTDHPSACIRAMSLMHPVRSLIWRPPINCWMTTAG